MPENVFLVLVIECTWHTSTYCHYQHITLNSEPRPLDDQLL